eukprot:CAMPEP_0194499574 /NCGR_PEP_ID=MMETSP0253-20130528/15841_1 /TAXON_ID=2966 /ORGANISM="Noctiluca scintillans" /LENGTH=49 /DNA_ID=CAMNT_0039341337 /DNA_START=708 /DNA_END=857 /DNA_ORIENTATION=-
MTKRKHAVANVYSEETLRVINATMTGPRDVIDQLQNEGLNRLPESSEPR